MDAPAPVDRRIRRTQKLLVDALLSLSLERGYDAVTIRDITERADIAYSTFFRHYTDKDQLLKSMVGEAVDTLYHVINNLSQKVPQEVGQLIFEHVKANQTFYRVILSGQAMNPVLQSVQEGVQALIIRQYQDTPEPPAFPLEIVANHLMTAILALIKWWMDHGMPYSTEEMASIYAGLIIIPTEQAIFGDLKAGQ